MKLLICLSWLVVTISASFLGEQGAKFQAFKVKHGKSYLNQAEEAKRFNIFKDNVRSIDQHNALYEQGTVSYKKGINKFTDMTKEEFKAMLTLSASSRPILNATPYVRTNLEAPASIDWRETGQVTEVKDQGPCGACWAFSITGSTEAAYYRKSGELVSLSEQQLIDCCTGLINVGCAGGMISHTFTYLMMNGIQSETSYQYEAVDGDCRYNASSVVTKVSDFSYIQPEDEDDLLNAVANIGPVSVSMNGEYLQTYQSGILDVEGCSTSSLDHAVLIVGYGTLDGKDFWIAKNSYGEDWGEEGYVRIVRGKNECGIAEDGVFPIIN